MASRAVELDLQKEPIDADGLSLMKKHGWFQMDFQKPGRKELFQKSHVQLAHRILGVSANF